MKLVSHASMFALATLAVAVLASMLRGAQEDETTAPRVSATDVLADLKTRAKEEFAKLAPMAPKRVRLINAKLGTSAARTTIAVLTSGKTGIVAAYASSAGAPVYLGHQVMHGENLEVRAVDLDQDGETEILATMWKRPLEGFEYERMHVFRRDAGKFGEVFAACTRYRSTAGTEFRFTGRAEYEYRDVDGDGRAEIIETLTHQELRADQAATPIDGARTQVRTVFQLGGTGEAPKVLERRVFRPTLAQYQAAAQVMRAEGRFRAARAMLGEGLAFYGKLDDGHWPAVRHSREVFEELVALDELTESDPIVDARAHTIRTALARLR